MSHLRRLTAYVAGVGLGLYLARGLAEVTRVAWALPALLALATAAAVAGLVLAQVAIWQPQVKTLAGFRFRPAPSDLAARQRQLSMLWTALPLWLYVLWPHRDPAVAWGVGLTVVIAWGWQVSKWQVHHLPTGTFVIALGVYVLTLAPGLQPADGGEFQLVAARFGVAHPPGYPLYTMLGGAFARLPLGPGPDWRLNLFSAVTAAATLALVAHTARRMTGSAVAGLVAALTLGTATTFWATATAASIRPLTAFFAALLLYTLYVSRITYHVSRPTLFALALGLGLGHHASLAFLGGVGLFYLLLVDPALLRQPRRWVAPLVALAATQLVWLYLPLRDAAGAPLAPGNLTTWQGLRDHILARGFAGDMFAFATPEHLPDRLALLPTLLRFQFNPVLIGTTLLGALLLLRRDRRRFGLLVGGFVLHTFVTLTYRAPQTVEYEMPAYVTLALLAGQAAGWAGKQTGKRVEIKSLVVAAVLVAGIFNFAAGWASFRDLAGRDDAREYAGSLLEATPEGSTILSNWHWATPLWYLQQVEGERPDVTVKYVAPQGESLAQNWVDAIVERAGQQPVVLVRHYEQAYRELFDRFYFDPLGPAFVARPEPAKTLPPGFVSLDAGLGGQVRLLGYTFEDGQPATLTLAWTLIEPLEGDVAFFAHLLRGGELVGQGSDRRRPAGDYRPGQVIRERFLIYGLAGTMPGEAQLVVGAYRPDLPDTPRLADPIPLTTAYLPPAEFPPITRRPRHVPFAGGPTLVGIDWDRTVVGQARLYLHWKGRSAPVALSTTIRRGDETLAQARVSLPGDGYVSSVYDLPESAGPLRLETDRQAIGPWGLARDALSLPAPTPDERYVPIGAEIVLMGAAVDKETPLFPGDRLRYDLCLVASRPLLRDRIVTVSLVGLNPDGSWAWRDASDGVPALGAMPTFKWVYGSTVLDRHRLTIPPDAPDGPTRAWLQVYDHYTQAILPPLDGRLLRQGLATPLDAWAVTGR